MLLGRQLHVLRLRESVLGLLDNRDSLVGRASLFRLVLILGLAVEYNGSIESLFACLDDCPRRSEHRHGGGDDS